MKCVADQERHVQPHPQDGVSFPVSAGHLCSSADLLVWGLGIEKYYVDELVLQKGGRVKFHFSDLKQNLSFVFRFPSQSIIWLKNILGKEVLPSPLPSDTEQSSNIYSPVYFYPAWCLCCLWPNCLETETMALEINRVFPIKND